MRRALTKSGFSYVKRASSSTAYLFSTRNIVNSSRSSVVAMRENEMFVRSFASTSRKIPTAVEKDLHDEEEDDEDDFSDAEPEDYLHIDEEDDGEEGEVRPLLEVLGEELEEETQNVPHAKAQFDDIIKELTPMWPSITHRPGGSEVKLERMLNGEHICVCFSCEGNTENVFAFPDEETSNNEEDVLTASGKDVIEEQGLEGGDFKNDQEEWNENDKFEFDVAITKGMPSRDGSPRRMLVACSLYKGEWQIERFGVDDGKMNDQSIDNFEGPAFKTLNEDLQESVYMYLHEKGISADLPEKLALLAQAKEQQEYTHWLSKLEEFLLYDPSKRMPKGKEMPKKENAIDSKKIEMLRKAGGLKK